MSTKISSKARHDRANQSTQPPGKSGPVWFMITCSIRIVENGYLSIEKESLSGCFMSLVSEVYSLTRSQINQLIADLLKAYCEKNNMSYHTKWENLILSDDRDLYCYDLNISRISHASVVNIQRNKSLIILSFPDEV